MRVCGTASRPSVISGWAVFFVVVLPLSACESTLETIPGARMGCVSGKADAKPGQGFDIDVVDVDFSGQVDVVVCRVLIQSPPSTRPRSPSFAYSFPSGQTHARSISAVRTHIVLCGSIAPRSVNRLRIRTNACQVWNWVARAGRSKRGKCSVTRLAADEVRLDWTQRRGLFYKVLKTNDLQSFVDETPLERARDVRGSYTINSPVPARQFYQIEQGE